MVIFSKLICPTFLLHAGEMQVRSKISCFLFDLINLISALRQILWLHGQDFQDKMLNGLFMDVDRVCGLGKEARIKIWRWEA